MAIIKRTEKGSPLTYAELDNNFTELDTIPSGKTFPSAINIGIKLSGSTVGYGWHTLGTRLFALPNNANAASYIVYLSNIRAFQFNEGNEAFCDFLIPHDFLKGSTIFMQQHWSHSSTVVTGGTVTWSYEIMYAKGYSQEAFQPVKFTSVTDDASNTPYFHQIATTPISIDGGQTGVLLDNADIEPGGIIQVRLELTGNDLQTSDGSTPNVFAHFTNIQYKSRGLPTLNKEPNFYT